jgi:hypothetical protein
MNQTKFQHPDKNRTKEKPTQKMLQGDFSNVEMPIVD